MKLLYLLLILMSFFSCLSAGPVAFCRSYYYLCCASEKPDTCECVPYVQEKICSRVIKCANKLNAISYTLVNGAKKVRCTSP